MMIPFRRLGFIILLLFLAKLGFLQFLLGNLSYLLNLIEKLGKWIFYFSSDIESPFYPFEKCHSV
jgi:hypothetical protein